MKTRPIGKTCQAPASMLHGQNVDALSGHVHRLKLLGVPDEHVPSSVVGMTRTETLLVVGHGTVLVDRVSRYRPEGLCLVVGGITR